MSKNEENFWEQKIYAKGKHLNRYPYDSVVSFIYNYYPKEKERRNIGIVEIGCGAGNNMWFCAKEGFNVAGVDISETAISYAKNRLYKDNLNGDLRVGNFKKLPWEKETYDLGIDRCSTVCVGSEEQRIAIKEMHRILKKGGLFFYNGYSCEHTSAASSDKRKLESVKGVRKGSLDDIESISYLSEEQVNQLFANQWEIISMKLVNEIERVEKSKMINSEWRVIAKKL